MFEDPALNPATARGYFLKPLPCDQDDRICEILKAWLDQDEVTRRRTERALDEGQLELLEVFAERMASLAVRRQSAGHLKLGLIALGLRGERADWRAGVTILGLCYDAAQRLNLSPRREFEEICNKLSSSGVSALRQFCRRRAVERSLEAMLYHVEGTGESFRYVRNW